MFFVMGMGQGQKKLNFDQLLVCGHCGKYGHLEVYLAYSYLSLFFIPVFKWGKHYYVRNTCCGIVVGLDTELGRKIQKGVVTSLPESIIPQTYCHKVQNKKQCEICGCEVEKDYQFCPKCGKEL